MKTITQNELADILKKFIEYTQYKKYINPLDYDLDETINSYLIEIFPPRRVTEMTKELIEKTPITIEIIYDHIKKERKIFDNENNDKCRYSHLVECRQITHFFCCLLTKHCLRKIAEKVGGKNHATVMHSRKKIQTIYDTELKINPHITNQELKEYEEYFRSRYK